MTIIDWLSDVANYVTTERSFNPYEHFGRHLESFVQELAVNSSQRAQVIMIQVWLFCETIIPIKCTNEKPHIMIRDSWWVKWNIATDITLTCLFSRIESSPRSGCSTGISRRANTIYFILWSDSRLSRGHGLYTDDTKLYVVFTLRANLCLLNWLKHVFRTLEPGQLQTIWR